MLRLGFVCILFSICALALADDDSECVKRAQWIETSNKQPLEFSEILSKLISNKVVLLGEDHDNEEHHRWQLNTIAQIHAKQPKIAIGFEAFPRSVQPILDRWVEGKLDEQEFLKAVDWENIWSYDANYYLPMFHYARMYRVPMIALNVKRTLVSQVGERGWKNISIDDREGVGEPAPASEAYRELLGEVFKSHTMHNHGKPAETKAQTNEVEQQQKLERFIEGQLVWDRAMAEAIASSFKKYNVNLVIGVMGAGHLFNGAGVPNQLQNLGIAESTSLLPWDGTIPCDQLEAGVANYVYGVSKFASTENERPRLGIFLELDKNGVKVTQVVPKSIAAELRIRPGDYILEAQSKKVLKVGDVVKAVQRSTWGNWMPLKIKRGKKELNVVAKFPAKDE